jgi:hypothetical protein
MMLDGKQCYKATQCFHLHYKDTYMNLYCYENLKYHLNMPLKKNTLYRVRHLTLPILSWQYCLCGLWEGLLTTVVRLCVALDSVNYGKLVRAAAHILCRTIRVKQVNRIRAARVSSKIWWWSATWGCTFKKNNRSVGASVAWDWIPVPIKTPSGHLKISSVWE